MSRSAPRGRPAAVNVGAGPIARWCILGVAAIAAVVPLIGMIEFTLRDAGGYSFAHWTTTFESAAAGERPYRPLLEGLSNSLTLVIATVLIVNAVLVPTMLIVHLAFPRLERLLAFVCIIPISIPAIVVVVGLAPVYSFIATFAGSATWTLAFAYGITTLPFAYRAISASLQLSDVRTLAEASRSLGASWPATFFRVLLPTISRGVLTASVLATAIVLGEYTIAALLNRTVLQTSLVQIQQTDAFASVIVSLLALAFSFTLLFVVGLFDGSSAARRRTRSGKVQ